MPYSGSFVVVLLLSVFFCWDNAVIFELPEVVGFLCLVCLPRETGVSRVVTDGSSRGGQLTRSLKAHKTKKRFSNEVGFLAVSGMTWNTKMDDG